MATVVNSVDTGHEDMIHDAEMDYYGLRLATCSSDNTVKVYDVKDNTHTLAADLKGHFGPVWQIAWSHPRFGSLLASCSYDRKVIIWKDQGSEWVKYYEYSNHDSSVNSVQWAPFEFGLILACGSSDGSISILTYQSELNTWDAVKIPNAHTIGCNAVSWCPAVAPDSFGVDGSVDGNTEGTQVVVRRLVSGGCDNLVKIWREESDRRWVEENKLEIHSDWVRDVSWAPSSGLRKSYIASCSQDRRVIIWTSENYINWTPNILHTFDDVVWNVSWSLSGNILAVSGGDNKVSLWKEHSDGQWKCISDVVKGQGNLNTEQRAL